MLILIIHFYKRRASGVEYRQIHSRIDVPLKERGIHYTREKGKSHCPFLAFYIGDFDTAILYVHIVPVVYIIVNAKLM